MARHGKVTHDEVLEARKPDPRAEGARLRRYRDRRLTEVLKKLEISFPLQAQEIVEIDRGLEDKVRARERIPDLESRGVERALGLQVDRSASGGVISSALQAKRFCASHTHAVQGEPRTCELGGNKRFKDLCEVD